MVHSEGLEPHTPWFEALYSATENVINQHVTMHQLILKPPRYAEGKKVIAKPWNPAKQGKYGKKSFVIDLQKSIDTCPAEQTQRITGKPGSFRAKYSSKVCSICPIKVNIHLAAYFGQKRTIIPVSLELKVNLNPTIPPSE